MRKITTLILAGLVVSTISLASDVTRGFGSLIEKRQAAIVLATSDDPSSYTLDSER